MNYYSKAIRAAEKFLLRHDQEVIDKIISDNIDLVTLGEDEDVHFVKVTIADDELPDTDVTDLRGSFEKEAMGWLADNYDYANCRVCFDVIDFVLVNGDRALLRYHMNALSGD